MSKRLRIAKRLLSDKGVIFISIDDNEQANLKLLCDEVFGADSFTGNVIWEKTDSPRMDVKGFTVRHDYILVYQKSGFVLQRIMPDVIPEHYNKTDEEGRLYYLKPLRLMGGHKSESLYYGIEAPDGTIVFPKERNGENGCWRWSQTKYYDEIKRIEWTKGKKGWSPNFRIYAENMTPTPASTIWPFETVGSTRTAKTELSNIIQQFIFSYPKPSSLIKYIEKIASNPSSTILDFFAGSGTTLHATMQLNAEDGGHRQCILVTNNENGICEQVTYERNKCVMQGYTTPKGQAVEGLHYNNLRYYRTEFIPRERTQRNMHALVNAATDLLCVKEDLYQELPIDALRHCEERSNPENQLPVGLAPRHVRLFCDGTKSMMIIYDERAIPYIVNWLNNDANSKLSTLNSKLKIYVFAPGPYAWDDDFAPVIDLVELCALPEAIYQAYKNVLPPQKQQNIEIETTEEGGEQ